MAAYIQVTDSLTEQSILLAIRAWTNSLDAGVVLVSDRSRILWANVRGQRILSGSKILSVREGVLTACDRDGAERLEHISTNARNGVAGSEILFAETSDERLIAHAAPVAFDGAGYLVLILRDPRDGPAGRLPRLDGRFGLTKTEQAVVEKLLAGLSAEEIAEQSGSSPLTVRTHIKHAYHKLGVASRGELSAKLTPYLSPL